MEELCVAAHHFLEPVPRAGAPGLAPQLLTEHVQLDVELRLHVGEEERLAEGDVGAIPVHNLHTGVEYLTNRGDYNFRG